MIHLLEKVYRHPDFTKPDLEILFSRHTKISFKKNELILRKGQTANAYYIIEDGLIRSFVHDYQGNEITTGFNGKGEIAIEVASLFQRIPTMENMQALSDCVVWEMNFPAFQELFHSIPPLSEWGRAWMAYQLYLTKKRTTDMITESAAERYKNLMVEKPQIVREAPLKYIASFLGITDTSLSRIRKEIISQC